MSWLFGVLQKKGVLQYSFKLNEDFQKAETNSIFLAVSKGINSYLFQKSIKEIVAIVGIPIVGDSEKKLILGYENINKVKPKEAFGHFVHLKYCESKLEITNDDFGLRDIYFIDLEDKFIFSTRLDLLNSIDSKHSLSEKEFSSAWLTNFQLTNNSIINGVNKLGPAGKIVVEHGRLFTTNELFDSTKAESSNELFVRAISNYSKNELEPSKSISLALSGGIDSRLILSILLNNFQKFDCHTLLNEENNDIQIAKKLCSEFEINHTLLKREAKNISELESEILTYYKSIPPIIPLTQLFDFAFHGKDYLQNKLILDGGFGGFYRRQYLNKMFFKGPKYFTINNVSEVTNLLLAPKPNIFNLEFHDLIENQLSETVLNFISNFKEPKNKIELSEILDLISIRFMLANVYSAGQTIFDQKYLSIMPLAQKDVVKLGMAIPFGSKSDSKVIKRIIKNNSQFLAKINLVNNNLQYPYSLNYKLAMIRFLVHRKFIKRKNYERYLIFTLSKEYLLDLLHSSVAKNNNYVDAYKGIEISNQFFNGDYKQGEYVDWLFAFLLWSKANNF